MFTSFHLCGRGPATRTFFGIFAGGLWNHTCRVKGFAWKASASSFLTSENTDVGHPAVAILVIETCDEDQKQIVHSADIHPTDDDLLSGTPAKTAPFRMTP